MTGFASAQARVDPFQLDWELKSVNHRYLDLSFRLPEELRGLEPELRERVGGVVSRGKLDCTLKLGYAARGAQTTELDGGVLETLRKLQQGIVAEWPDAMPLSTADLLRWPGVVKEHEHDFTQLAEAARAAFTEAVAALDEARQREGERIASMLEQRLDGIRELMQTIAPLLEGSAVRYRDKLLERIAKLDLQVQPERLEQELALIAQRLDVTEEADRLEAHVAEIDDVLGRDEPIGRRLDFLIQELNREANTLASKAQDEELARRAVDLKVLIEQMREQVQNVE